MITGDDIQIDPSESQIISKLKTNFETLAKPSSQQSFEDALHSIQNTLVGNAFIDVVASSPVFCYYNIFSFEASSLFVSWP
jgi:hypothetical protein